MTTIGNSLGAQAAVMAAAAATTTATSASGGTSASTGATSGKELDKDAFLKLLVAQLKYQDPDKPADPTAFMAQTAQFTMIEKLDAMAQGQQDLITAQFMLGASN